MHGRRYGHGDHSGADVTDAAVRPTRAADAPLLPAVERSAGEAFRGIADLAWLADDELTSVADHLDAVATATSWVAVEHGGPVGFVMAEVLDDELHVWELAVQQDRQGRGLGRRLMQAVIGAARDRGLSAVTLTTFQDVPWNRPFYERLGFTTLRPGSGGTRLEAVLQAEAARGLPRRCAMRLVVARGSACST